MDVQGKQSSSQTGQYSKTLSTNEQTNKYTNIKQKRQNQNPDDENCPVTMDRTGSGH
jgi:hypothetical protein